MQIPVHKPSKWALVLALTLAAGCDNQVTEPTTRMAPDDAIQAARAPFNSVIALEPLPGSANSYSAAYGINDLRQVVGESSSGSTIHAVIWDNSTIPQDLGTLTGHVGSGATAISSAGTVIAGMSRDAFSTSHAVRWLRSNGQWLIDPLPSGSGCFVNGMSSDGTSIAATCGAQAVVWQNGSRIVLGTGSAMGVNSNGQAVGTNSSFDHAVLWNFSTVPVTETDLGTLGGTYAVAVNINDAGQVTGWSENADHVSHAFLWSPRKGVMIDLAPGPITSGGYSVNATGKVAGDMFPSTQHGGYYDGRKVVDLGVLPGYNSSFARALNNNGQIVGWSATASFQTRATMWLLR